MTYVSSSVVVNRVNIANKSTDCNIISSCLSNENTFNNWVKTGSNDNTCFASNPSYTNKKKNYQWQKSKDKDTIVIKVI
jgi:hypothetical protein